MISGLNNISGYIPSVYKSQNRGNEDISTKNLEINKEKQNQAKETNELTEEEKKQVDKLKQRDREVRTHEQQHLATAGSYALGGPQFEFTQGPDGKQYVINGHVNIDTSEENSPEKTIEKARKVKASAMAPAEPSSQDLRVAAKAAQMEAKAQKEIREKENSPENNEREESASRSEINKTESPDNIQNLLNRIYNQNTPKATAQFLAITA